MENSVAVWPCDDIPLRGYKNSKSGHDSMMYNSLNVIFFALLDD